MGKYYYDLHIHSCLSPCGDTDMTPANIAGMAAVAGLQIAALTDHNTTENCPAFWQACKAQGIIPVPGVELTTAEEIHLLCLFRELDGAMAFGERIAEARLPVKNRPDIFGRQLVMDCTDQVLREEETLLLSATSLTLEEGTKLCRALGGVCMPAHIDRESNGVLSILGTFPTELRYTSFELSPTGNRRELESVYPALQGLGCVTSSDAHYLWDISGAEHSMEIPDEPYNSALVRENLLAILEGK
ncbi:MAG: PHP domain-containing protein [Clostridiales bacterium]|nr:PHP domain-containing protein [Clostridiales bacterium]